MMKYHFPLLEEGGDAKRRLDDKLREPGYWAGLRIQLFLLFLCAL